mmetsp:Transcript_27728/g.55792  ORF Transcript_27728/g.55792 Transcript_27728/m.55792 type:complete len:116 (-) Transcript_27728:2597-2944(-)
MHNILPQHLYRPSKAQFADKGARRLAPLHAAHLPWCSRKDTTWIGSFTRGFLRGCELVSSESTPRTEGVPAALPLPHDGHVATPPAHARPMQATHPPCPSATQRTLLALPSRPHE